LSLLTSLSLSVGYDLAIQRSLGYPFKSSSMSLSIYSSVIPYNSGPVIAIFFSIASSTVISFGNIPAYLLIAIAVNILSPVTIRTLIPAFLH